MTDNNMLTVSEVFGPTVQGEGPSCGQQALFIRLSGCNLSCSWCDTPYTWDWTRFDRSTEQTRLHVTELAERAIAAGPRLVVITGGEPLMQRIPVSRLAGKLVEAGLRVEIETNGTIAPILALAREGVQFNVSPKLAHSQQPTRRINDKALAWFAGTGQSVFKFVAQQPSDLDEIADLKARFGFDPVWVMPEGTDATRVGAVMRDLADDVVARGWNLTPRLHIELWGDRRGR